MNIYQIWMSQRKLKRSEQLPGLIKAIKAGLPIPKIILDRAEDGEIQVQDGHHRLAAYALSGRTTLDRSEYLLLEHPQFRARFRKLDSLLNQLTALDLQHANV